MRLLRMIMFDEPWMFSKLSVSPNFLQGNYILSLWKISTKICKLSKESTNFAWSVINESARTCFGGAKMDITWWLHKILLT